jgi:large-conductance mechanosensitive channel
MNHEVFTEFVSKSNIYTTVIAILITSQILVLVNSIFDNIVSPIINSGLRRDKDTKLKDLTLTIYDINLETGPFLLILVKFITIMLCIYYIICTNNIKLVRD